MVSVVAAIDFGTHGTGYAWTEIIKDGPAAAERSVQLRLRWPDAPGSYPKDLSALLVAPDGSVESFGHQARRAWTKRSETSDHGGYTYVEALKMALKVDGAHGTKPLGVGARSIDSPAKAFPLVVASLRRTYELALADIDRSGYGEDQIRWCLTVPVIWDEQEKQLMRDAAVQAGLPADPARLLLAIEPEVAALYCRIHLARLDEAHARHDLLRDGGRFLVLDCGGGTVDLVAYRVDRDPTGQPRLSQLDRATGGKFGSEYVDDEFVHRVLEDRFGGPAALEQIQRDCPHALLELLDRWEEAKLGLQAHLDPLTRQVVIDSPPVSLPVPGDIRDVLTDEVVERLRALSGNRNKIVVAVDETRDVLDTVLGHIIELTQDQLAAMAADGPAAGPEQVLLVGGLSESTYLQARLRQAFGDKGRLVVPPQPAAAVLAGACTTATTPTPSTCAGRGTPTVSRRRSPLIR
ncbi:Hsp70 family protein [Frankia sp. CIT1]|uniref:Hsp70 family protein n=1 Tax=Frankia sp. CIT1 TaxID=2880974 RepID=UPI001EF72F28|nr:hypothetical protein [Frankia sp. CIT1]